MPNPRKYTTRAMSFILLCITVAFIVVLGRVIYLETAENEKWTELAKERTIKERPVSAQRGNIYSIDSDNGELLLIATDKIIYDVYIDLGKGNDAAPGQKKTYGWIVPDSVYRPNIRTLCKTLSSMFNDRTAEEYREYFQKNRRKHNRYVLVHKSVTEEQLEKLKTVPIIGKEGKHKNRLSHAVMLDKKYKRVYPYGDLARRTIGITVRDDKGNEYFDGLDGYYDDILSGEHRTRMERKISANLWVPIDKDDNLKPLPGADIVTTIDVSLQELAENALRKCLDSNKAESGTVILMETSTGYVKAISNLVYNKTLNDYKETSNISYSNSYEPGSTFKIVTAMMLLDKGLADTGDVVPGGMKLFPGSRNPIYDVNKKGPTEPVSFCRALEVSSNVGISSLVYDKYGATKDLRKQFAEDLRSYFIYDTLGSDLALHEPKPIIRDSRYVDDLLRMSFGYVTSMTPLQMLTFYNGIANNGRVMKPLFAYQTMRDGVVQKTFSPVVLKEKMCKEQTLKKIQEVLKRVVQYGTGRRLKSAAYGIAGKSGTAEMNFKGESKFRPHRASFVGYFPADNPQYSCIVVISRPQKALTHGGDLAAPVFRELSDRVMGSAKINYAQQTGEENDYPLLFCGSAYSYYNLCRSLGLNIPKPTAPWVRCDIDKQYIKPEYFTPHADVMPNVKGLSLRDALYMLNSMGLKVTFKGIGKVKSQSIPKGTRLTGKERVELSLGI